MTAKSKNAPIRATLRRSEKSPKPDDYTDCTTLVFDFDAHWNCVKPHLENPKLQATLKRSLEKYLAFRAELSSHLGMSPKPWRIACDPTLGPWQYGDILGVRGVTTGTPEQRGFCVCCGEEADLYIPEPGSREWYQAYGAGSWLAAWQKELGEIVFPDLCWKAVTDGFFGFAYGTDQTGEIKVVFDIMDSQMSEEDMILFLRSHN